MASAPECQMAHCAAASEEVREHPDHGAVAVCPTCARLWRED